MVKFRILAELTITSLALMETASFPAPLFGQERYSGQQEKAPKKAPNN